MPAHVHAPSAPAPGPVPHERHRIRAVAGDGLAGFLARLGGPITLAWALGAVAFALPRLALYPPAHEFMTRQVKGAFLVTLFWFAIRAIEVGGQRIIARNKDNAGDRSIVPLVSRALEIAVHGWDVSCARGVARQLPHDLAQELLELAPLLVRPGDRPARFAVPTPVPQQAGPAERLLAFLGRSP